MPKTLKEHYVPQFYLKGFANADGKIAVFNPEQKCYHEVLPKNICAENNLYETQWHGVDERFGRYVAQNDIENIFCNYEGEFAELIQRIKCHCVLAQNQNATILKSESDKELLIKFIVNLHLRNPKTDLTTIINHIQCEVQDNEAIEALKQSFEMMNFGSADSICEAAIKKGCLTDEFENGLPQELAGYIQGTNFAFFYAQDAEFITSDRPACIGTDDSISDDNKNCAYLALTPKIAVLFGNYDGSQKCRNRMFKIDKETVDQFNIKLIEHNAYNRFYISTAENNLRQYMQ